MKIIQTIFALTALVIARAGAADVTNTLLPLPQSANAAPGSLELTGETSVSMDKDSELVGRYFAERLRRGTGWTVPVATSGTIRFEVVAAKSSPEAYTLQIGPAGVIVRASSPAGIARGAETLLQLMPPAVYGSNQCATLTLPEVTIMDAPQFAWRGLMLDVARKFQDKDAILKLLDGMAASKLNVFHWHLTDDEGWRLPIQGYPNLTKEGPAYSREDIRAVVEHASALGITILPEIDMPGHSGASCRAYPAISILNSKGHPDGTMNPGADASYAFIEAVLNDVCLQFPASPYVHIGADEVSDDAWNNDGQCKALMQREHLNNAHEVYVYFVNRVVAMARGHGKRCVAWDEAFDAKNDPSLIIMSWRGTTPGIDAAKAGRDVVFCPNTQLYFNHANSRSTNNPVAYDRHTSYLSNVYFFNPDVPAIPVSARGHVLGGEGCLWGEWIRDAGHMFTMMFPRADALGETLWMPRERLDWPGFLARLAAQRQRYDSMEIPYFWETNSLAVNIGSWKPGEVAAREGVLEFKLDGKLHNAGVQEFFVAQGAGEGQFDIDAVELLKNGVVVDEDRHTYESSIYKGPSSLYLVKNADLDGQYSVRLHVKQLFGDCAATVQLIPALAANQYSSQCAPDTDANRTKQNAAPQGKIH